MSGSPFFESRHDTPYARARGMFVAFACIGLIYLVAARLFANAGLALFAAAVLAATPLLWRQSHTAPAFLYPLFFVFAWLIAIAPLLAGRQGRASLPAASAGALLGLGMYAGDTAIVMMPLYLALTVLTAGLARIERIRLLAILAGAFCVAVVPLAVWAVTHPEFLRQLLTSRRVGSEEPLNALQGLRQMASWVGLTARTGVYYEYLNPVFLFVTSRALPLPLVVLLPAGILHILTEEPTPPARLALAGFFAAPFAGALIAQEIPIEGGLTYILPFAPLVAAYGLRYLIALGRRLALHRSEKLV